MSEQAPGDASEVAAARPSDPDGPAGHPPGGPPTDRGPGPPGREPEPAPAERSGPTVAELEHRWRRAAADLDNLRKRYTRELRRERTAERELVAAAFLPVLDNIDRALEHAGSDPESIIEGVRALREQALAVLAGLGYSREDEAGVPFDPARHEVVGVVEPDGTEAKPGSVATVVRPGYGSPDRQLRPAAVTVAQAAED
jgi:molecular chaperone GrpE